MKSTINAHIIAKFFCKTRQSTPHVATESLA